MNNSDQKATVENLNTTSRAFRAIAGAGLIVYAMMTSVSPLGWLALLPLLAIFPICSAISGWCPLRALMNKMRFHSKPLSTGTRTVLALAGSAAIASVYVTSGPLGYIAALPLLGVYPLIAAIIGEEPISALFGYEVQDEADQVPEQATLQVMTGTAAPTTNTTRNLKKVA